MAKRSMFVGMDVHKESIDVSLAEEGRSGEVRRYGVIPGDLEAVAKVVRALRAPNRRLRFVYEAGPCGFGLARRLKQLGVQCEVVAPSLIPKRSGDRVKPAGAMRANWPDCCGPVNSPRCTFLMPAMKRSGICAGPGAMRWITGAARTC